MNKKPINRTVHGILDYVFAATVAVAPELLSTNKFTRNAYRAKATLLTGMGALTDTPVGIKPLISFKTHKKLDMAFLAGFSVLGLSKPIRENKRTLLFHLAYIGLGIATVLLTDFDSED